VSWSWSCNYPVLDILFEALSWSGLMLSHESNAGRGKIIVQVVFLSSCFTVKRFYRKLRKCWQTCELLLEIQLHLRGFFPKNFFVVSKMLKILYCSFFTFVANATELNQFRKPGGSSKIYHHLWKHLLGLRSCVCLPPPVFLSVPLNIITGGRSFFVVSKGLNRWGS